MGQFSLCLTIVIHERLSALKLRSVKGTNSFDEIKVSALGGSLLLYYYHGFKISCPHTLNNVGI